LDACCAGGRCSDPRRSNRTVSRMLIDRSCPLFVSVPPPTGPNQHQGDSLRGRISISCRQKRGSRVSTISTEGAIRCLTRNQPPLRRRRDRPSRQLVLSRRSRPMSSRRATSRSKRSGKRATALARANAPASSRGVLRFRGLVKQARRCPAVHCLRSSWLTQTTQGSFEPQGVVRS
jgi:hypothetical protein